MAKIQTRLQFSAGGVAFRTHRKAIEVALISVGDGRWQLPKGLIDKGESTESAAIREVREEAGINAEPLKQIDRVEYWYYDRTKRVRYHKFVYFFLLRYKSGDVADHDHEVNEARWFEIGEALNALTFENEKQIMGLAREMIETL